MRLALSIWRQEFGTADTPLAAVLANPPRRRPHIADNTVGTLRLIVGSTFDHFPLLAPPTWPRAVARRTSLVARRPSAPSSPRSHGRNIGERCATDTVWPCSSMPSSLSSAS
jgi:hypothetical protein